MISLIFALDRNNLFGNKGQLAWHYSEDLQYFKQKTLGKKIIMGEATFYSVLRNGKPLPNRTSVVATFKDFSFEGVEVTHDVLKYLDDHRDEDLFVIGGKSIIELTYKKADVIYMTYIDADHEGDTYLNIDLSSFELESETVSGVLHFRKYLRK